MLVSACGRGRRAHSQTWAPAQPGRAPGRGRSASPVHPTPRSTPGPPRLPTPTVGLAPAATVKGALWPPSELGTIVLEGLQELTVGAGRRIKVEKV